MKAKTKEKQNKPFYAKWWFWIIIGLILFGNIAVLIWFNCKELKSDLLTLISGWVSFVATLIIGVIAFRQSKEYKEENDKFIEEQKDLMWRQSQINVFTNERDAFSKFSEEVAVIRKECLLLDLSTNHQLKEKLGILDIRIRGLNASIITGVLKSSYFYKNKESIVKVTHEIKDIIDKWFNVDNSQHGQDKNWISINFQRTKHLLLTKLTELEKEVIIFFNEIDTEIIKLYNEDINELKLEIAKNKEENLKLQVSLLNSILK